MAIFIWGNVGRRMYALYMYMVVQAIREMEICCYEGFRQLLANFSPNGLRAKKTTTAISGKNTHTKYQDPDQKKIVHFESEKEWYFSSLGMTDKTFQLAFSVFMLRCFSY